MCLFIMLLPSRYSQIYFSVVDIYFNDRNDLSNGFSNIWYFYINNILSAECWGNSLVIIIIHYSPCVLGFQNRPIVWSMRVIRGDRRVQVVRWGPLSLFLLFFLLFSVLFFSHTRISCLGWGGWFRLLPRSFFLPSFVLLISWRYLALLRAVPRGSG